MRLSELSLAAAAMVPGLAIEQIASGHSGAAFLLGVFFAGNIACWRIGRRREHQAQ